MTKQTNEVVLLSVSHEYSVVGNTVLCNRCIKHPQLIIILYTYDVAVVLQTSSREYVSMESVEQGDWVELLVFT